MKNDLAIIQKFFDIGKSEGRFPKTLLAEMGNEWMWRRGAATVFLGSLGF
jgi:hypothetical protein